MAHKKSLEALDRTLKDLRSNHNRFGGAMILLLGDFRQTLPVIPRSTPADELNPCLTSSNLWKHIKYPQEFLNSLDLPGLPPHNFQLKVGSVAIMLRNINQPRLCNGTRLAIKKLLNNVIEATILKGKYKGEDVLIPRIPMTPTGVPFEFKRLQFPVRLAFAMTINKSQGQSLSVCGINLKNPCFSHGQLYVACSRAGKPSDLFVYAPEQGTTRRLAISYFNCVTTLLNLNRAFVYLNKEARPKGLFILVGKRGGVPHPRRVN
ncbi:ATP-dependent DNA helicase pif1 [Eumeta japonica]|uniref:ATP-dependent DNA helicase n=1 Tax=Eumeta variegata TaxID=151549 RepID=A0A4C1T5B4_EUMVA|nr:ATP-dependent DNA helicase pif1 [Eumeta japonica]